jgi:Zn-dependent M28 family amino/carboxypeptidase
MQSSRGKRVRRVLWFLLIVFALALLALLGYALRFDPDAEDLPGQRAALADRTRAPATATVDGAAALADLRALADPAMEGRAAGTPGGARARAYLLQRFHALGLAPAAAGGFEQAFTFTPRQRRTFWQKAPPEAPTPVSGVNLVARIPGTTDPTRHILVSAHYDHLGVRGGKTFVGADDNASGVAALLAVAAHFKAHPPRHSLLIVAFDAEEQGLRGARAFVASPPVPLERIALVVNFDMVSRSAAGELVVAGTHAHPQLRALVDPVRADAIPTLLYGHDRPRPVWDGDDWTRSSDHGAFVDAGIPWLYVGVEDHPDYHQPTDTADKVDPRFFADVVGTLVDLVAAADAAPAARLAPPATAPSP